MIFITSYPYVYGRHIRVFDFFEKKDDLFFILPEEWKSKGGKLVDNPVAKPYGKLVSTPAYFWHSRYPLIRGQLKGWMPATRKILKKFAKPGDVLLTSIEPNMLVTYLNARIADDLKLKHVFITWQNVKFRKLTEWLIRQNVKLSAGVMCGTNKALEIFSPYLDHKIRTAVIPQSGVDTEIFQPDVMGDFRQKYKLENKFVFLFGAVFDERKGVFTTIGAFKKTVEQIPNAHLVMIGLGKLWELAKQKVKEFGLENNVTFVPWMENGKLPEVFASCDVLLHPSEPFGGWEEQYGWTILQASACGLPVIATRIGSIPEAVLAGKTGVLVEPKNVYQLSDAMIDLAKNKEKREILGKNGVNFILERFSHKVVAGNMENFLRSL